MTIRQLLRSPARRKQMQRQLLWEMLTKEERERYRALEWGDGISVAGNAEIRALEDLAAFRLAEQGPHRHRKGLGRHRGV